MVAQLALKFTLYLGEHVEISDEPCGDTMESRDKAGSGPS